MISQSLPNLVDKQKIFRLNLFIYLHHILSIKNQPVDYLTKCLNKIYNQTSQD